MKGKYQRVSFCSLILTKLCIFFKNFPSFSHNLSILNHLSKPKLYTQDTGGSHIVKPKCIRMVMTPHAWDLSAGCSVHLHKKFMVVPHEIEYNPVLE